MLRLRTSSSLSLLALVVGIVGTGWLSGMTGDRQAPAAVASVIHRPMPMRANERPWRWHGPVSVVQSHRVATPQASVPPAAAITPLRPLATPDDSTQSWSSLRGHLDGRVLMHVDTDARGDVRTARVLESSGDPVLDQHALRSVRRWRFAVPADQPQGVRGELSMRFTSRDRSLARLP
ncbi:MAG TPA: TonB family protein [Rhodanobacter sp.]|nr:TonB family protein [Rhodanobacter sp.]